ncbi:hypothetical protein [Nostoc sp. 106C]|uniref:hypothetical protein n=1 Tax=Nostoc sp. 106C TaxID=1932667 RepID=UPI001FB5DA7D|nr:hypothetical protein [Nostoc sp. 106C]
MAQTEKTQRETIEIPIQSQNISRREFMKLPLEERRRILAEQAELILPYYQQNTEWQELETGDLVDY